MGRAAKSMKAGEIGYARKFHPSIAFSYLDRPLHQPLLIVPFWDRLASDRGAGLANEKRKVVQTPAFVNHDVLSVDHKWPAKHWRGCCCVLNSVV